MNSALNCTLNVSVIAVFLTIERSQLFCLGKRIVTSYADKPVVARSQVQNRRRVNGVYPVQRALPRKELEEGARRDVVEVVVVGAKQVGINFSVFSFSICHLIFVICH